MRVKCRDEHQGIFHEGFDAFFVRLDTHHAIVGEAVAAIGQEADGLKNVVNDYRFEHVEFKMAV